MRKPRLSEIEAAEYLGITVGTLRNWRVQRRGPDYVKIGRVTTFWVEDLDRFIEQSRRLAATKRPRECVQDAG